MRSRDAVVKTKGGLEKKFESAIALDVLPQRKNHRIQRNETLCLCENQATCKKRYGVGAGKKGRGKRSRPPIPKQASPHVPSRCTVCTSSS
jgi:hypothetical protein